MVGIYLSGSNFRRMFCHSQYQSIDGFVRTWDTPPVDYYLFCKSSPRCNRRQEARTQF